MLRELKKVILIYKDDGLINYIYNKNFMLQRRLMLSFIIWCAVMKDLRLYSPFPPEGP